MELVPPFRFGTVEDGVYRGAFPVLRNFNFLRRLKLRTILSLTPESATYDLREFASAHNITLKYIQTEKYKGESVSLLAPEISDALQVIINAENHPLYVHCLDGRHVVGTVIMALRKLQLWENGCSHHEYLRFVKERNDEVAFIMDYGGPLTIPENLPTWLWGGSVTDAESGKPKKHPSIKFKGTGGPPGALGSGKTSSKLADGDNDDLVEADNPPEASSSSPTLSTTFFDVQKIDQMLVDSSADAAVALSLRVSQQQLGSIPLQPTAPVIIKRRKRTSSAGP